MLSWSQQKSLSNPGRGATPPSSPLLAGDTDNVCNEPSGAAHVVNLPSDSDSPPAISPPVLPGAMQQEDVPFERPSIASGQGVEVADTSAGVTVDDHGSSTEIQSGADEALSSQADQAPPAIVPRRLSENGGQRESMVQNGTSDEVWELRQRNASSLVMTTEGSEGGGVGDLNASDGTTAVSTLPNRAILRGRSSKVSLVLHPASKLHP